MHNPRSDDELYALFRELIEADRQLIQTLVAARRKSGLTQADVAEMLDTDQSYISRFESGNINPRMRTVREYAAALGLKIHHEVRPFSS